MSPLWPETIYAGLFPGQCWLQRGRKAPAQDTQSASDPMAWLQALDAMLAEQAKPIRRGSRLVLTVSDSIASIASLPWQEQLSRPAEVDSYAHICFEKRGVTIDEHAVMRAEFRHFGGMGLAYALPRAWLEALLALTETKGLRLVSVLPVSAAAYCHQRLTSKAGSTLLILQEAHRCSAIIVDKSGLLGYDVEPQTRSPQETQRRLLRRVGSGDAGIARVVFWSSDALQPGPQTLKERISDCLPDVEPVCLQRDVWN